MPGMSDKILMQEWGLKILRLKQQDAAVKKKACTVPLRWISPEFKQNFRKFKEGKNGKNVSETALDRVVQSPIKLTQD